MRRSRKRGEKRRRRKGLIPRRDWVTRASRLSCSARRKLKPSPESAGVSSSDTVGAGLLAVGGAEARKAGGAAAKAGLD